MSLQTVHHLTFGTGTVTALDGKYLTVDFGGALGEKTFIFPDAFAKFLRYDNEEKQAEVCELFRKKQEKIEMDNAIKEAARRKAAELAAEEHRKMFGKPKSVKKVTAPKRKKTIEEIVEEVVK